MYNQIDYNYVVQEKVRVTNTTKFTPLKTTLKKKQKNNE